MHRVGLALLASWVVWLSASEASAYCRLTTAEPSATGSCSTTGRGLAWQRQCISYSVMDRERTDIPLATMIICGFPRTSMTIGVLCPKAVSGRGVSHFTAPVAF